MRRGSGVALTALLLSLLFHAALLAGIWGWGPISLDPVDAPVVEARLLVDPPPAPVAPALPQKALTPASAIPPALPPPRATQAVVDVPEANPDPAPVLAHAPIEQALQPEEPSAAYSVPLPPDPPPAATDQMPPPRLNPLPARIDMRFGVHYGVASGEQTLVWVNDGERYTLTSVASATGLAGLFYRGRFVQTSTGRITPGGLQPEVFWDQRGDKRTSANLDAASGRVSLTTASGDTRHFRYRPGMQDALSLFLQLALTAPPAGEALRFVVFNGKKVRDYQFELLGETVLETDLGPLRTLHLARVADPDGHFEAWLAIDRAYLPVKVRRSDDKGNSMELRVRSMSP
jgi:hypothetical protein